MLKRLMFAAAALALFTLSTGCATVVNKDRMNQDGGENIPWNTPAGWESEPIF